MECPQPTSSTFILARDPEDHELARQHYSTALTVVSKVGDPNHRGSALRGLGSVASATGKHAEAKQRFEDSLSLIGEAGDELARQHQRPLIGLGHACCALGEIECSWQHFCRALDLAVRTDRILEALDTLMDVALLSTREGELERAGVLHALAVDHPAAVHATRARARELLGGLSSQLPSETPADAVACGQSRRLQEVAAEILADYRRSEPISSRTAATISSS